MRFNCGGPGHGCAFAPLTHVLLGTERNSSSAAVDMCSYAAGSRVGQDSDTAKRTRAGEAKEISFSTSTGLLAGASLAAVYHARTTVDGKPTHTC